MSSRLLAALVSGTMVLAGSGSPAGLPDVIPNDNRVAAGRLVGDTLHLALDVVLASWRPDAAEGPAIAVAAFAEAGQAPRIPGPLIRVPAGTVIDLELRNGLKDSAVTLHGLQARPITRPDSIVLAPGARTRVRFTAGDPGTYYYWAAPGTFDPDWYEREQLAGALIVDPPGPRPDDRIFVMNIWGEPLDSTHYRNALAINGRSFPWNERITAALGDTLRWRWINATIRNHPMHLHGFYFNVEAKGDGARDTLLAPADRRMAVTENMFAGQTMAITWSPDRPGNWLFHCHIGFHIIAEDTRLDPPDAHSTHRFASNIGQHMGGLVLGISVEAPPGWRAPEPAGVQRRRLLVQEGVPRSRAPRRMGYVLDHPGRHPAADSAEVPGPVLVFEPGVAEVTVVNRLREATAVHWHGIELESYWDGVVGWSGSGTRLAPRIEPESSFVARLLLPRPGTFIYHTHLNDLEQFTSGLYGAIVVLPPGQSLDPLHDHLFVVGWDGPDEYLMVNGDTLVVPKVLPPGRHRFRFINIGMAIITRWSLWRDDSLQPWRPLAKDGADLPETRKVVRASGDALAVGETADFEAELRPGSYRLRMALPNGVAVWEQELTVRAEK